MQIDLRANHASDEGSARTATGKSLGEWFALLDDHGGPELGRREIGNHLHTSYKLDPWWIATLNIEYEAAHGLPAPGRP